MTTDNAMVTDELGAAETSTEDRVRHAIDIMNRGARICLDGIPDDPSFLFSSFGPEVSKEIARILSLTLERGEAEPVAVQHAGIKPLDWQGPTPETNGCHVAHCIFGTYSAVNEQGWYVMLDDHPWGQSFEWSAPDMRMTFDDAAKAAQADYERRILSTLSKRGEAEDTPVAHSCHPSHATRPSDASSYDEVCTKCGATDITGGGRGKLAEACPHPSPQTNLVGSGDTIMKADVEKMIRDWQTECADHPALHNQGNVLLDRLRALKPSLAMNDFLTGMDALTTTEGSDNG